MLVAIAAAGSGGCKRATLGGAPDAGGGALDGGMLEPTGDGGAAVAGDGGTVIGADGPGLGDRNASVVDAGADGAATDALAARCPDQAPAGGSACDVDVYCSYPAHTVCSCNSALGYWVCQSVSNAPAGCPDALPFYGAPCAQDQLVCRYNFCIGYAAVCCDGTWVPMLVGACSE